MTFARTSLYFSLLPDYQTVNVPTHLTVLMYFKPSIHLIVKELPTEQWRYTLDLPMSCFAVVCHLTNTIRHISCWWMSTVLTLNRRQDTVVTKQWNFLYWKVKCQAIIFTLPQFTDDEENGGQVFDAPTNPLLNYLWEWMPHLCSINPYPANVENRVSS